MIAADIFLPCCISSLASQSPKDGLFIGDYCSTRQCLTALETAMLTLQDEEVLNVLGETWGETQGVHYSNWRLPCKKTTFIRFQKVLQVLGKRHIQTCLLKIGHGINWLINGSSMGMVRGLSSFAHLAYPYKTCHQPKVRRPCWNLVLDVTTDQQFPKNLVISSTAAIQQFLNHSNLYPTGTGANWRRSLGCYEQLMFQ